MCLPKPFFSLSACFSYWLLLARLFPRSPQLVRIIALLPRKISNFILKLDHLNKHFVPPWIDLHPKKPLSVFPSKRSLFGTVLQQKSWIKLRNEVFFHCQLYDISSFCLSNPLTCGINSSGCCNCWITPNSSKDCGIFWVHCQNLTLLMWDFLKENSIETLMQDGKMILLESQGWPVVKYQFFLFEWLKSLSGFLDS